MWSDTLFALERTHLLRLAAWGAASVLVGTALVALLAARRIKSPLLQHFAIQLAAWGAIDLLFVAAGWRGLAMRDLAGATQLDRMLWMNVGLSAGYVAVGVTLAACAWIFGRRLGGVGAGLGVIVQGLALLVLDLSTVLAIGRFM